MSTPDKPTEARAIAALLTAGDVMAVLYRTLNGDGQKKEKKND